MTPPVGAPHVDAGEFFEGLAARPQPLLRDTKGTLRFDVTRDGETTHWYLTIAAGDIVVTQESAAADSVVRIQGHLFDDILNGRANAMAAVLRGDLGVEGSAELLMRVQRTFPGPKGCTKVARDE